MNVNELSKVTVQSVYSGRNGACCCGCAGKHTYNSRYVEQASKSRGYEVTPDEVNDRVVAATITKMQKIAAANPDLVEDLGSCISVESESGTRLYLAYLVDLNASMKAN